MSQAAESLQVKSRKPEDPITLLIVAVVLAGLVFSAYQKVIYQRFVIWDDSGYYVANDHLAGGLTWENVKWAFTEHFQANYHPLTWISMMADVSIYGMDPWPSGSKAWGFKLTNLIIHAGNTVLVYWLFFRMTGRLWPSFIVAGLFGLHPLHVESVAWATERKDVLSTLFALLAMDAYIRYVNGTRWLHYGVMLFWFILSLFAKQMYVTLPAVLVLLDYWPLGRLKVGPAPVDDSLAITRVSWWRSMAEKLPLLALAVTFSIVIYWIQVLVPIMRHVQSSPWIRISNALVAYAEYLKKMVWPMDLIFFYPYPSEPYKWSALIFPIFLLSSLSILTWAYRRKAPYLIVGWLWYLGTMLPVIGLVQVGWQAYADRYTYFSLLGPFFAIVFLLDAFVRGFQSTSTEAKGGRMLPKLVIAVELAAIAACFLLTDRVQVPTWNNTEVLSEHALKYDPDNYIALVQLGILSGQQGRFEESRDYLDRSYAVYDKYVPTIQNLATMEMLAGNWKRSCDLYERVHFLSHFEIEALYQAGLIHLGEKDEAGRPVGAGKAIDAFKKALEAKRANVKYKFALGLAYYKAGELESARKMFQEVADFGKERPNEVSENSKDMLRLMDQIAAGNDAAKVEYSNRFDWPPTVSGAITAFTSGLSLANRAGALARSKNETARSAAETYTKKAIEEFERAVKLWPQHVDALYNLGVLYSQKQENIKAQGYFRRLLDIDPNNERAIAALQQISAESAVIVEDGLKLELLGSKGGSQEDVGSASDGLQATPPPDFGQFEDLIGK